LAKGGQGSVRGVVKAIAFGRAPVIGVLAPAEEPSPNWQLVSLLLYFHVVSVNT
jgi:hypothetical protein